MSKLEFEYFYNYPEDIICKRFEKIYPALKALQKDKFKLIYMIFFSNIILNENQVITFLSEINKINEYSGRNSKKCSRIFAIKTDRKLFYY